MAEDWKMYRFGYWKFQRDSRFREGIESVVLELKYNSTSIQLLHCEERVYTTRELYYDLIGCNLASSTQEHTHQNDTISTNKQNL